MLLKYILLLIYFIVSSKSLNIDDFGAKSNDSSYDAAIANGKAIESAVNSANSGLDRIVYITGNSKTYTILPVGVLLNATNIILQIDARINAYNGNETFWPKDLHGRCLAMFSFLNSENLVIRGNGTINGLGYSWWWNVIINGHDNRPDMVYIDNGIGTVIDGISLYNSPQFHLRLLNQLNCTVKNVKIHVDITDDESSFLEWLPTFPLNTDGIDISGKDIYFKNLTIQNFDDAVAVKPTRAFENTFTNCTENILIEDCSVTFGVGMSIGSVPPSSNIACIRNVTFRNIKFDKALKAIYIKPNPGDIGLGIIKDITYENINITNTLWWSIFIGTQQQHQPHSSGTPCSFFYPLPGTRCQTNPLVTVDNIILRNINIYGGFLSPGVLVCNSTNPCTNFLFDNVNVYNRSMWPVQEGFYCENVKGIAKNSNLFPQCFQENKKI